jgi:hypothetical protein
MAGETSTVETRIKMRAAMFFPIDGSKTSWFYAALQMGGIKSPLDAVRAAILTEHKSISC